MRKGAGGSMGLVALLALVMHTQFPSSSEKSAGRDGGAGAAATGQKGGDSIPDDPIEGPWIATQAYFQIAAGARKLKPTLLTQLLTADGDPDSGALRDLLGLDDSKDSEMWSIVATLPSPLHTRMMFFLDAQLEAIERSLQSAGWEFAGQWLPWMDRFDASEGDIGERRRQRRLQLEQEQLPGVLIFRSTAPTDSFPAQKSLFVFVVPETATSGISGPPFYAALHMANMLSTKDHEIGLLAPTFSGSFSSLTRIVTAWQRGSRGKGSRRAIHHDVYSGAASNVAYAKAFETGANVYFHSGIVNTRDYGAAVCTVLDKYHIKTDDAALLKEDESGYSQAFSQVFDKSGQSSACVLPTYVFPRDISHLRNAYQEATGGAARDPYTGSSPSISFSIKDPNSGEDSIPEFSDVQTPLSQEAVLDAIMHDFRRRRTKLVFIAAVNSLDTVFLMRVVRRDCPDTRVVIENPDVLFVSAASHDPLTGTLLLSSYPMFPQGDQWLDQNANDRLIFPDSVMQGLYNVTQFLLDDLGALLKRPLKLRAYRQFKDERSNTGKAYPGLWLLTLNRFGLLPLDLLPVDSTNEHWLREDPASLPPDFPTGFQWPHGWEITVVVTSSAIFCACLFLVWCNVSQSVRKPFWLVLSDGNRLRMQALLGACLSLTALEWILASPAWPSLRDWLSIRQPYNPALNLVIVGVVTAAGLLAPVATFAYLGIVKTRALIRGLRFRSVAYGLLYCLLSCGLFGLAVYNWYRSCYGPEKSALFFRFRAVDLSSGSSPAAPLAFLSLLFFCVALFQFKRYTLAGPGRPRLYFTSLVNGAPEGFAFDREVREACDGVNTQIMPASPGFSDRFTRAAVGLIFVLICFGFLGFSPRAFELPPYNWALLAALPAALFCLAIGCYDLVSISRRLDRLLRLVELLPLQPAIERVVREWPRRPIWALHSAVSRHALTWQMLYALHRRVVIIQTRTEELKATAPVVHNDLKAFAAVALGVPGEASPQSSLNRNPAEEPAATTLKEAQCDLDEFRGLALGRPGTASPQDFLKEREEYQKVSADVAARIHERDLRPVWRKSLNEDEPAREGSPTESAEQKYQRYCSDFLALQVCRFFIYVVEQVRRIALSISVCSLLLILFFNSYSPQGSQMVARFVTGLFVAVGCVMVPVFARMERNPTLSRIARTKPGELNRDFWLQLIALGGLPLLGVVAHLFPPVSQFLFQWVAPSVEAAH